jgi:hypothetical protein
MSLRLKPGDLERLVGERQINPSIAAQIRAAEAEIKAGPKAIKPALQQKKQAEAKVSSESKGEASVRVALIHAFGDWFAGGEVVAEFRPFLSREFRADFALPRYRIYVEIDGWEHHGKSLDAHHDDRERGLFFSQYDWLPFRVSHKQATKEPTMLVDAITKAMAVRSASDRAGFDIEKVVRPVVSYTRLVSGHCDAKG